MEESHKVENNDNKLANEVSPQSDSPSSWKFVSDDVQQANLASTSNSQSSRTDTPISWTASEFIEHHKSVGWYLIFGLVAVIIATLAFIITHDKVSTAVIIFASLILGGYSLHQPRILEYKLDELGLHIGTKFYSYDTFKSYWVDKEEAFSSVVLMPLKRFMPPVSLYYDPKSETKILDTLSARLPLENPKNDFVDNLMRRIRY